MATSKPTETFEINRIGEVTAAAGVFGLSVDEAFRPGLRNLDNFSHVIVLWWASETPPQKPADTLIVRTTPYVSGPSNVGVFSTRSPERPSRIGLSVSAITDVGESSGVVGLGWIDAVAGTPVVDLKPYFPSSDRVRDVLVPEWCSTWPSCLEDSAEFAWERVLSGD